MTTLLDRVQQQQPPQQVVHLAAQHSAFPNHSSVTHARVVRVAHLLEAVVEGSALVVQRVQVGVLRKLPSLGLEVLGGFAVCL